MANSMLPTDAGRPVASGTLNVSILRSTADSQVVKDDRVAVEAPLEFLLHHPALGIEPMSFGTTMRTPGDDESLAAGLLYGEGIVNQAADIDALESSTRRPNVVNVRLPSSGKIVPNPRRPHAYPGYGARRAVAAAAPAKPHARGAVEVRRHRRRSRLRAVRFCGDL